MEDDIRKQYDSLYASKDVVFGNGEPVKAVTNLDKYIQTGTVLDIGGGEGRNAVYLAGKGFDVTVTDVSEVGLEKIKSRSIKTKVSNILTDGIDHNYDAIIISNVLFHFSKEDALGVISKMKEKTNNGGVNVIVTFSNDGYYGERNKEKGRFYPSKKEIKDLYSDWDIKEVSTHKTDTLAKDKKGNSMENGVVAIIASKI